MGFRAIHRLLGPEVGYLRMDAFALDGLDERFDFVYCCGILHRVETPLGLLRVLGTRTVSGGTVVIETTGLAPAAGGGRDSSLPARRGLRAASRNYAGRRGEPKAVGTLRQDLLVAYYHVVRDRVPFRELGPDWQRKRYSPEHRARRRR